MLKQRVITALVLLSILLPAVFSTDTRVFGAVALVLICAGAWEWARLNSYGSAASLATGTACAVLCLGFWLGGFIDISAVYLWISAGFCWVMLSFWLLRYGAAAWNQVPQIVRLIAGSFALALAWLAVLQARRVGINFLFSVLVLVWAADVFAYFAGRAWGGKMIQRKLAPAISPGKTWEGALGGAFGVMFVAFGWLQFDSTYAPASASLYSELYKQGYLFMVVSLLFLTMMSVVGDLVESFFKRFAGVKDSSGLLPGHGGVLDRVDALLPVLPLAMMLVTV
jgi:phosphatidate cytidylyltransferase